MKLADLKRGALAHASKAAIGAMLKDQDRRRMMAAWAAARIKAAADLAVAEIGRRQKAANEGESHA